MKLKKKGRYFLIGIFALLSVASMAFKDAFFDITRNLELFTSVFRQVNNYYVDNTKPGELMKVGIDSMLQALDPYTNYISESEIEDYRFMTTGQYGGIGSMIRKKGDFIVISEPYEGFAADKAGLMAGDVILEIDGKTLKGKNTDDVSKILKGQPGTTFKMLLERDGVKMEKEIKREEIKIKAVPYYGMLNDSTGYIALTSFTEDCAKEVKNAFKELLEKNQMKSLVLDLRGNPGGLLNESITIANLFVDKGKEIVSTRGKVIEWQKSYKALDQPINSSIPMVVLVNSGSASASEIVSGSLQDLDRAVIIGQRTYGKGLVQTTRNLSYNSKLKVTTAKYYIPSGRCIQALDYSHRNEDGSVGRVPDSLTSIYKTGKGRPVKDGGGIFPDVYILPRYRSAISRTLDNKFQYFEFAHKYRKNHPTIDAPEKFSLSEAELDDFLKEVENNKIDYVTSTEKVTKEFKKISEKEMYFEELAANYKKLEDKVLNHKSEDLKLFREDIKKGLEAEIVTRYYYQKGRIKYMLSRDTEVAKALEILKDKNMYNGLLAGTYDPKNPAEERNW